MPSPSTSPAFGRWRTGVRWVPYTALVLLIVMGACGVDERPAAQEPALYRGIGVVRGVTPSGAFVQIDHEAIPGFMEAMNMPFAVADSSVIWGISVGDSVRFELRAAVEGTYITRIEPIGR
jgi:protein SCO1/2